MGRRGQLQIAGTERKGDVELEDMAAIYRGHVLERVEMGKLEKEAKEQLEALIERKVAEGSIVLPPDAEKGKVVTIHRFEREGEDIEIKYGRRTQVRVRLAKDSDDETELME